MSELEREEPLRIWWNKNLHGKISAGKLAAHAAHAALAAYGIKYTHPIVVLAAGKGKIEAMPINIRDAGHTELAEGTLTTGVEDESHRWALAEAYASGVAEGIRQAREEVRMLPCYGTRETGFRFDEVDRADVLEALDALKGQG